MAEVRKVGRPNKDTGAREKLLFHARELFMVMAYDKVSIRLIASKAEVNSSLIRYYFGNKEGLFETMLRETIAPMREQLALLKAQSSQYDLINMMRTYYQQMSKTPQFPRLISQVMHMPPSKTQRKLMDKVIGEIELPFQHALSNHLAESGVLRSDMDPRLCRVSFISLMVFPFIAPPSMLAIHGVELNEEFLNQLLEHNIKLMTGGFLVPSAAQD